MREAASGHSHTIFSRLRIPPDVGASAPVTNAVAKLYLAKRSGETVGAEFAATSTSGAVGDNSFRFDGTGYIFNLATKGLGAGTYQLRIDLGDGVSHTTDVKLS